jgi:hypothetical protein
MGYESSRLTTNIVDACAVSTIFLGVRRFPRQGEDFDENPRGRRSSPRAAVVTQAIEGQRCQPPPHHTAPRWSGRACSGPLTSPTQSTVKLRLTGESSSVSPGGPGRRARDPRRRLHGDQRPDPADAGPRAEAGLAADQARRPRRALQPVRRLVAPRLTGRRPRSTASDDPVRRPARCRSGLPNTVDNGI